MMSITRPRHEQRMNFFLQTARLRAELRDAPARAAESQSDWTILVRRGGAIWTDPPTDAQERSLGPPPAPILANVLESQFPGMLVQQGFAVVGIHPGTVDVFPGFA